MTASERTRAMLLCGADPTSERQRMPTMLTHLFRYAVLSTLIVNGTLLTVRWVMYEVSVPEPLWLFAKSLFDWAVVGAVLSAALQLARSLKWSRNFSPWMLDALCALPAALAIHMVVVARSPDDPGMPILSSLLIAQCLALPIGALFRRLQKKNNANVRASSS
jgi:hypothetical protein